MAAIKLKPGESVVVTAVIPDLYPDQGLPTPPTVAQDPGYGIDLGLGYVRPTHPIVLPPPQPPIDVPPPPKPVDPAYGIDVGEGYVRPTHPIVLPGKPELKWELKTAWTPETGWVVVAIPVGEHPAPSKK